MLTRAKLDRLYIRYNKREHVNPDPLQFLYGYTDIKDREIVGMVASSLAYGRVAQIIKNVSSVFYKMGPSPYTFLLEATNLELVEAFKGFKHRFTDENQLVFFLGCLRDALVRFGSLNECFLSGYRKEDEDVLLPLKNFIRLLTCRPSGFCSSLFPDAGGRSAFKRFNLFLRWMVRKDDVDPGGWKGIRASQLIIPLDTHMHKISLELGLTERSQADILTALEVTRSFKRFCPKDPVKYDFSLTRLGIKNFEYVF